MHTHNHKCTACKHDCLHYCDCCNKVFCCKCKQEWGGYQYWYQPYYTWTVSTTDANTTTGNSDTLTTPTICEVHSHN